MVEGPIERHKSRLASREAGDGIIGTKCGGVLDRTETVPKWSRQGRARAGLREDSQGTKSCAREASTVPSFEKCR